MILDRGTKAIILSCFFIPLLLGFMFYMIALSQQHKLTWEAFISTNWAAPYYALGSIAYLITTAVALYWVHQDNKDRQ